MNTSNPACPHGDVEAGRLPAIAHARPHRGRRDPHPRLQAFPDGPQPRRRCARYTLAELADVLHDRGLRTRPTARHLIQRVSISKLAHMLRDPYYLGYITYKGEQILGRHQALVDEDLFNRVQLVRESRAAAQERRRVHHHYLKGSLFCG